MPRFSVFLLCLSVSSITVAAPSIEQLQQLIAQEKYVAASNRGSELLRLQPGNTSARFLTAYAYQMIGVNDTAIRLYQELLRDVPELPEPRNNLAMIYLARGDYDRASQLLVDAIRTHPSYATAYDNLSEVYKGIASEAYRRAVSESSEPASYTHNFELTAISRLNPVTVATQPVVVAARSAAPTSEAESIVTKANLNTLMIETVRNWAGAWSSKDFESYIAAYLPGYRSRFETREGWIEHRRKRIVRPGKLSVDVSDFKVIPRNADRITVDFTQAFQSPGYRDRVIKRLDFVRSGDTWKIASERVLSVL